MSQWVKVDKKWMYVHDCDTCENLHASESDSCNDAEFVVCDDCDKQICPTCIKYNKEEGKDTVCPECGKILEEK